MDNSKFLKGLLAVVEKQQAALKKLAQGAAPFTGTTPPPPQGGLGDVAKTTKRSVDVIQASLPATLKALVGRMEVNEPRDELRVQFNQGATQATVDELQKLVDGLVSSNTLVRGTGLKVTPV